MSVTLEEVKEYLATQQIELPDSMLARMIARIAKYEQCFADHGYDSNDIYFIYCYLLALLALFGADGRVRSQGAPSGASRSFFFGSTAERWKQLSSLLAALDPEGCVSSLVPPDPDKKANCALFISPGAAGCSFE
jgi:hypothetical protein